VTIENEIEELKKKLQYVETEKLLYQISQNFQKFDNTSISQLKAPKRQYMYLIGLLMSTKD